MKNSSKSQNRYDRKTRSSIEQHPPSEHQTSDKLSSGSEVEDLR